MIPFYIYYSMFGFQRIGDLAWAAGDIQARGFMMGGTAGRTTLNGEGLQHQDGHSHIFASTIPNCISYDPTYTYELAVILQDGMRRMYKEQESVFYYIAVMNENYRHPDMPEGAEEGIIKGIYKLDSVGSGSGDKQVQLLGSGAILREVEKAAVMLLADWGVSSDIWSVTSFNELARDGADVARWNRLHPTAEPRSSYVAQVMKSAEGPVIAATDYIKMYAEQVRDLVPGRYETLGTDGFGRSDTREKLRDFFEVDRNHITVAALKALADDGVVDQSIVAEAIVKYGVDTERDNPITR
jgi:pyruvate dehydrogenase E1 component